MAYKVYLVYPGGERKLKSSVQFAETALKVVAYYERFFDNDGVTKSPSGKVVNSGQVEVELVEE